MQDLIVMSGDIEVACTCNGGANILDESLVPIFIANTHDIESWVASRAIDSARPNSRHLKRANGLSSHEPDFETATKYHAACITDNFWIKNEGEDITWNDVRFTDNAYFQMAVASDDSDRPKTPTPELTNIGSEEKGWKLCDGEWWLYKNESAAEQEHEYITYLIGSLLGFDMAEYELAGGMIRTRDFTYGRVNLQHANSFLFDHEENGVRVFDEDDCYGYETLLEMDENLADEFVKIKCLDAIVNNTDRHVMNFGVLTAREDGHIIKMAPNFDNNQSFYGLQYSESDLERNNGLMRAFLEFVDVEGIKLDLPLLTSGEIRNACPKIDDVMVEYIMNGYDLVKERLG